MSDVTNEGERLIKDWQAALTAKDRAKSDLNRAECEAMNAENALAKWLTPDKAEPGEKFSVWYGNGLVEVTIGVPGQDSKVRWRQRNTKS
jgi:hypothetical protein